MHESFTEEMISARFTFLPERAEEFLASKDEDGNWVYTGQLVTQMDFESIEEVMEAVNGFRDALVDVNAIINGQVVNLSEQPEE